MPYPATHSRIGLYCSEVLNLDGENLDLFLLGNLLADLKIKGYIERSDTHYYKNGNYLDQNFINNFLFSNDVYLDEKPNYLVIGYFLHLLTDEYFIENFKGKMEEYMWEFRRKYNAIIDIGENINIFYKLKDLKTKTNIIRIENVPSVFKNIDIEKIRSEFRKGIETTLEQMHSDMIEPKYVKEYLVDHIGIDIERDFYNDRCNLVSKNFLKIIDGFFKN